MRIILKDDLLGSTSYPNLDKINRYEPNKNISFDGGESLEFVADPETVNLIVKKNIQR